MEPLFAFPALVHELVGSRTEYALIGPVCLPSQPGDVIRFTANNTVQFYSDNSDGADSLADRGGLPAPLLTNVITVPEVGPEGSNGALYLPTLGQPGYNPAGGPQTSWPSAVRRISP